MLVTTLTLVLIGGITSIVILLVLRLGSPLPVAPLDLPERLDLPADATAEAVTLMPNRVLVVADTGELLVFDRRTGALRQRIVID